MLRTLMSTLSLFLFLSSTAFSVNFEEGTAAYDAGDYEKAVSIYSELLKTSSNGSLLYNLGNSYYRLEKKGEAIAAYLAARTFLPRDPDLKANLNFVHNTNVDKLSLSLEKDVLRAMCFWVDSFTQKELFYTLLCFACLAILCFLFSFTKLSMFRSIAFILSSFTVLFAFVFFTKLHYQENWGAVRVPLSKVYSGPSAQNTLVFELHEGAPAIVESSEGDWFRIRLSDNKMGWVFAEDLRVYVL